MTTPAPDAARPLPDIVPCPPARRREAILLLAAAGHDAGRTELAQAVDAHLADPAHDWDGLLVAMRGQHLEAALWVQPLPGRMAQLWQPALNDDEALTMELLAAARQVVEGRRLVLCQTTLGPDERAAARRLEAAGMTLAAPLEYLTAPVPDDAQGASERLRLMPWRTLERPARLALLAGVRRESLDCVALRDVLGPEALLAGFHQQDDEAPRRWHAVYAGGDSEPSGVLLLARRPEVQGMELLLMGLVPEARGRGLGREVLAAAFGEARAAGAKRLLLSVDITNAPARRLYAQAGFVGYARQQMYAWLAPAAQ